MAKAKFTLSNGTMINIEGSPEEIHKLLKLHSNSSLEHKDTLEKSKDGTIKTSSTDALSEDYITQIVNFIKDCKESDAIEKNIIDRSSQVNRVLLPLYIIHEYLNNNIGLQSGEISKITKELGIPISQPNVSIALSGVAARYVMGNKVRKAKHAVKYKLNRRGVKYLKGVIEGKQSD
jgi:hypothetical protein